jgi:hypothetical protein
MVPMMQPALRSARRRAWLRRLACIALATPLAALAVMLGARALPPEDEAQAAIARLHARLQARAPVEDGYALLHFAWRPDVPREGVDEALAALAARERALLDAARRDGRLLDLPVASPMPQDAVALATCMPRCLDDAAPGGPLATLAARHADALARTEAALHAPDPVGHGRITSPRSMPDFLGLRALVGLRAVTWRAGRREEALQASCLDLQAAERMALAHPDSGIEAMVGINQYQLTAGQLAMMLAEAPGIALPPACQALLAPPVHAPADALCRIVEGEFAWVASSLDAPLVLGRAYGRGLHERWEPWLAQLESPPHAIAAMALQVQWACSSPVAAAMEAGRVDIPPPDIGWHLPLASPLEAWLPRGWAGWQPYRARLLGIEAARRAVAARLHLHAHGRAGGDGLAGVPAWTRAAHAPLSLGPAGLSVPQPASVLGAGHAFVLPMPAPSADADPGPGG